MKMVVVGRITNWAPGLPFITIGLTQPCIQADQCASLRNWGVLRCPGHGFFYCSVLNSHIRENCLAFSLSFTGFSSHVSWKSLGIDLLFLERRKCLYMRIYLSSFYLYNNQIWIGQVRKLGPGQGWWCEMIIPVTRASQGRPNTHLV